jgi:hypothetical protein
LNPFKNKIKIKFSRTSTIKDIDGLMSEEAVRRKDGGGGPKEWGISQRWGGRVARVKCGKVCGG